MSYDSDQSARRQGLSGGAQIAIGCGVVGAITLLLLCGGVIYLTNKAQEVVQQVVKEIEKKADDFAVPFEAQGYDRVTGQIADVSTDIKKPTVYTVQMFKLNADSAGSLAVMAQIAEINGRIDGDLTFYGQQLTIHKDAVITGNLHVQMAQMVDNRGTVEGEVIRDENSGDPFDLGDGESDTLDAPLETDEKPAPGDVIETTPEEAPAEATPADETSEN